MTQRRVPIGLFVKCPFCDYPVETTNPGQWCAGCLVEWYESRDGEFIVFDTERNKFALARAFAKAGGVRMCQEVKVDLGSGDGREEREGESDGNA